MSYLIEQLHQHIIGHGTCFSELIKLERPGKEAIPILMSAEVPGPTVQDVLETSPQRLTGLDPRSFTELIWLAILTNPEDGLPTNYVLHTSAEETPTLVSVDHDHALFPAFALQPREGSQERTWILGNTGCSFKSKLFSSVWT